MEISSCTMDAFSVIGKEGSTSDGDGFIKRLWTEANAHFDEVAPLAARDEDNHLLGIWGAMSDVSRSFRPWEDGFTKGLYLAGIQARSDAEAPNGWVKWTIPAYEYLYVKNEGPDTFAQVIRYLEDNAIPLAGAVHDYNCPEDGQAYLFFPIRKL